MLFGIGSLDLNIKCFRQLNVYVFIEGNRLASLSLEFGV